MKTNKDYIFPVNNLIIAKNMKNSFALPYSTIYKADTFLKTKIAKKIIFEPRSDILANEIKIWIKFGILAIIHKKIFVDDESDIYEGFDHLSDVSNELYFLISSIVIFSGQTDRLLKPNLFLGLKNEVAMKNYYSYNPREENINKGSWLDGNIGTLVIDDKWHKWQKTFFFYKLRDILIKEKFGNDYRKRIYNAMVLVGKGQVTTSRDMAFLYNMIAIETILCQRDDKYSIALPERLKALYGGTLNPKETFSKQIESLYQKRCAYVHNGDKNKISWNDVRNAEKIIFNLLYTVAQKPILFKVPKKIDEWVLIQKASEIEGKRYVKNRGIRGLCLNGKYFFLINTHKSLCVKLSTFLNLNWSTLNDP